MSDNRLLTERPSYQLGKQHVAEGIGDFYRRKLFGDERRAYMLGRSHAISEKHQQERKAG
jgi:hypothetical protein